MFMPESALLFVFRSFITQPGRRSDSIVIQTGIGMCFVQQGKGCSLIIAVSLDSTVKSGKK